MFSMIRKRFTYANVAMTLALVFAMSGGAYAAKKYLITSTKQISPKVLKTLKGKPGPAGAAGLAGAAGPAGPAGSVGAKGETGAAGKEGTAGKEGAKGTTGSAGSQGVAGTPGTPGAAGVNGTSVTSTAIAAPACTNKEGGSEFTVGSTKTFACNGKEGSPWTAGGTLPSGKSETGTWAYFGSKINGEKGMAAISFTLPLEKAPKAQAEFVFAGSTHTNCKGSATAPTAPVGYLCVYDTLPEEPGSKPSSVKFNTFFNGEVYGALGAGKEGALAIFETQEIGTAVLPDAEAFGTWVVTAE
jgi:Collagen triple helix repeat (20 copies)